MLEHLSLVPLKQEDMPLIKHACFDHKGIKCQDFESFHSEEENVDAQECYKLKQKVD